MNAADRISGLARVTPVLTVNGTDLGVPTGGPVEAGAAIHLKLEQLQHSGSFKARGAANTMRSLPVPEAGVVAASGGNHGAAVAWAARELGHQATVFVPSIAARAKIDRLTAYDADVRVVGDVFADALRASQVHQEQTGALAIHAYDDEPVMEGAATTGLELEAQIGLPDVVLVACGGGGLAGGLASWFGTRARLVVVETEGTATFAAARRAGRPTLVHPVGLAADSLGASVLGSNGWDALASVGAESVLVTDDEVTHAQRHLWDTFRLVTEPAAAAPIAALLAGRVAGADNIGVIVCGANTTVEFITQ